MNKTTGILSLIIIIVVLVIGISITGMITLDNHSMQKVIDSTNFWLNTEEGSSRFPGGVVGEPINIYADNTTDIIYILVPIKNLDDLYMGFIITDKDEFERPHSDMKFAELRSNLFMISKDEAYSKMIEEHPEYSAGQISEPRLVYKKGQYWMSEVTENGKTIDELYVTARSN